MVKRAEKLSAADLCKCGHWRGAHDSQGDCFGLTVNANRMEVPCPCCGFTPAVHEAELTKGAKR